MKRVISLTRDVYTVIISHLPIAEVLKLGLLNKWFLKLIQTESTWKHHTKMLLERFPELEDELEYRHNTLDFMRACVCLPRTSSLQYDKFNSLREPLQHTIFHANLPFKNLYKFRSRYFGHQADTICFGLCTKNNLYIRKYVDRYEVTWHETSMFPGRKVTLDDLTTAWRYLLYKGGPLVSDWTLFSKTSMLCKCLGLYMAEWCLNKDIKKQKGLLIF